MYNYYDNVQYFSNSNLGVLERELKGKPPLNVTPAMEQGRLLHEAILEPHKADTKWLAHPKVIAYQQDAIFTSLLRVSKREHEIYRKMTIDSPCGFKWATLKMRCKVDLMIKNLGRKHLHDLKFMSGRVSNPKATIQWMNYDRQAALYMDMARADSMTYWFEPGHVFTIRKNDSVYLLGRRKYMELAWKAYLLGEDFKKILQK